MIPDQQQQEHLTVGEFIRWTHEDRLFKQQVLTGIASLQANDLDHAQRIAIVETEVANTKRTATSTSMKWSAGLTTILTIVVQAIMAAMGSK